MSTLVLLVMVIIVMGGIIYFSTPHDDRKQFVALLQVIAKRVICFFNQETPISASAEVAAEHHDVEAAVPRATAADTATQLGGKIEELERQVTRLIAIINKMDSNMAERLNSLDRKVMLLNETLVEMKNNQIVEKTPTLTPPPQRSFPIERYAFAIDSKSPKGFMDCNLCDSSKGCCFQIEIKSDTEARYRLSTEPSIMHDVIDAFIPIISESAQYDDKPPVIMAYDVLEPGELRLIDGVWSITKPQVLQLS